MRQVPFNVLAAGIEVAAVEQDRRTVLAANVTNNVSDVGLRGVAAERKDRDPKLSEPRFQLDDEPCLLDDQGTGTRPDRGPIKSVPVDSRVHRFGRRVEGHRLVDLTSSVDQAWERARAPSVGG